MKTVRLLLVFSLLSIGGIAQTSKRPVQPNCGPFIYERLRNYFEDNEERPSQIINNTGNPEPWKSGTQKIAIGRQTVEWIDDVTNNQSQSSLRINGELITLSDKITANAPDEDSNFKLEMVGQWDQIRLYELFNQTIIAVSISARQCTGLMCGVGAQLWYDIKTKQKTFFGTYRTDPDARLFRFTNEEAFYVLSTNFRGDPHGVTGKAVIKYELYKLQSNGQFHIQKDGSGENYFLKHTSVPDRELGGKSTREMRPRKADCLEQNWLKKILVAVQ